jgi:hypothetical protein
MSNAMSELHTQSGPDNGVALWPAGSLPGANREFEVAGADNYHVRYLIAPTVRRMKEINVAKLRIELRGTKILFLMEPAEDGPGDERQPEENIAHEPTAEKADA